MSLRTIPEIKEGTYRAKASGTLPNGKPVVVNSDGTVSVVEETSVTQSVGSPTVFESAGVIDTSATFDSSSNRVVIAYRDTGNSNYGTAVVGTVSGTSISFGTPTVFDSSDTSDFATTFDFNENKVVIAYRDNDSSQYGTAIVGTVSSTSISFGSPTVFNSAGTYNRSITFDSSNNKVVIAYRDFDGSSHAGTAIVGTVSSTSISFGSPAVFENSLTQYIQAVYDSVNNTVIIAYMDGGDSDKGKATIGTVSGTSISFSTPVTFYDTAGISSLSASFDAGNSTVVLSFRGTSAYGIVLAGTTTASSFSFGDPLTITTNAYNSTYSSSTYDPDSGQVVLFYADQDDGDDGKAAVYTSPSTNLTSENYIGLSEGGTYADGSSATIDIVGMVNTNQTGLTPGQQYYVQTDGTLDTAEGDPSVLAGTAVTSTSLLVKL